MSARSVVLMVHGFTGSGAGWQPVLEHLGQRYRALTPDIRGHACASDVRPVTLGGVLDDLERLTSENGVAPDEPFTLVGYSQGGRIALHAALDPRLRERLRSLVLIGASPGIDDPVERDLRRAADERLADEFEQLTIAEIAERWARTPILGGITAEQAARARTERLRSTPAGLAAALRGLGTGALPSLWDRLGEITVPVLLISGTRDHKFGALNREMAARLPDPTVVTIPGAGHAVQLEQPQAVADAMDDHLRRLAGE